MKNLSKTLAISAISLVLATNSAQAADFEKSATIELQSSIEVVDVTDMNFGVIGTSASAQNVTLLANGDISNDGDGGVINESNALLGQYTVNGGTNGSQVSATAIGTLNTDIVFTSIILNRNSSELIGIGTSVNDLATNNTINLRGTLNIPAGLTAAVYEPQFTLTIDNS